VRAQRGVEVWLFSFFNLGARRGEGRLTPLPNRFTPRKRPGTHGVGGWVGSGASGTGAKNLAPPGFCTQTFGP